VNALSATSMARLIALLLFTVSWYSSSGTLSATIPPPAWICTCTEALLIRIPPQIVSFAVGPNQQALHWHLLNSQTLFWPPLLAGHACALKAQKNHIVPCIPEAFNS
jgi:hypothetical protein